MHVCPAPYVEVAYLAEMIRPHDPENFVLVIAAGVVPENAERAGRAISTKLLAAAIDGVSAHDRVNAPETRLTSA